MKEKADNTEKVLITSYENPDIDGIACMLAYAEYLGGKGRTTIAAIFGTPTKEAQHALDKLQLSLPDAKELLSDDTKIILVDSSGYKKMPIPYDNVIEVIDHRKLNKAEQFKKARVQIELVGACATLIAEKIKKDHKKLSANKTLMLYAAIISNTVNLRSVNTTDRDKEMVLWLKKQIKDADTFVAELWHHKSQIADTKEALLADYVEYKFGELTGTAQVEIIDVDAFIGRQDMKKSMEAAHKEKGVVYFFLIATDIMKGATTLLVHDDKTKELLENALGVVFFGDAAFLGKVLMRKEIMPMIEEYFAEEKDKDENNEE